MDGHNDKRGEVDFLHVLRETRAQGDPVTISPRTLTWFTKLGRLHERDTIEFVSGIERELEAALSAQSSERATMGEQIAQDAARDLDNVAAKIMTGRNMAEEEARIVTRGARMLERLSAASARLPSMICPRCEVDRLKTACPNRVGCPMVGDSRGPG
jgi:rubrerythrin